MRSSSSAIRRLVSLDAVVSADPEGRSGIGVIRGRFRLLELLGVGASGRVHRALDLELGREVALKVLAGGSRHELAAFKREFRIRRDVVGPNLVQLFELHGSTEEAWLTMELVRGSDLVRWVRDSTVPRSALGEEARARIVSAFSQLANGLLPLHDAGLVHRDLKPANVLVEPGGRVVILDFGLAVSLVDEDERSAGAAGTLVYAAPEQAWGLTPSAAADAYSVGALLYECLVGEAPFAGSPAAIIEAKETAPGPDPRDRAAGVPDAWAELATLLLDPEPARRPPLGEVPAVLHGRRSPRPSARPRSRFVGREAETTRLAKLLQEAVDRPLLIHVTGPSGIGKTELVARTLRSIGGLVLRGRCHPQEAIPFEALDAPMDQLARALAERPDLVTEVGDMTPLMRLFPAFENAHAATPADASSNPQELQLRAFAALRAVLAAFRRRTSVSLWIDDAQWGDADSARAIAAVLGDDAGPAITVLLSHRSEGIDPPFVAALRRSASVREEEIVIGALDESAARELARTVAGAGLDEADLAGLVAQAGAIPFFVRELAHRAGAESGRAEPLDLAGAILDRIHDVGPGALALAEVATVAGGVLTLRQLLDLAEDAGDLALLHRLREGQILRPGTRRAGTVEPYHDRIRETLLAILPPDRRRRIHRRAAALLQTEREPDPEALLEHHLGAGDDELASEAAFRAAGRSERSFAFDRAAELYGLAHRLRARGAADWDLRASRASCLANAGDGAEAGREWARAATDATVAGGASFEVLRLRSEAARNLLQSGELDHGLRELRVMLAAAGLRYPETSVGAILALLRARLRLAARGLGPARAIGSAVAPEIAVQVDACWAATVGLNLTDFLRSAVFQARHTLLALEHGSGDQMVRALVAESVYRAAEGGRAGRERAQRIGSSAEALARSSEDPKGLALARMNRGIGCYFSGRWEEATAPLLDAEEAFRRSHGAEWETLNCVLYRLAVRTTTGDVEALARELPVAVGEADSRGNILGRVGIESGEPNLHWLLRGRPDQAREHARRAIQPFPRDRFQSPNYADALAQSRIDLYEGDAWAAFARSDDAWRKMQRNGLLRIQLFRVCLRSLRIGAALAAAVSGDGPPASLRQWTPNRLQRFAARESARLRREDHRVAPALAALTDAVRATHLGPSESAASALSSASRELGRVGMRLHGAMAAVAADRLRERPVAPSLDGADMIADRARFARVLVPGLPGDFRG